jgi:hypothetical protein
LDSANAVCLAGGLDYSALPQQHRDAIALLDHAIDFRLLTVDGGEDFPGSGNNVVAPPPRSIQRAKSRYVKLHINSH